MNTGVTNWEKTYDCVEFGALYVVEHTHFQIFASICRRSFIRKKSCIPLPVNIYLGKKKKGVVSSQGNV